MKFDEGFYFDLSFEEYQRAEGISQSLLKEFGAAATPLHFSVREPKKQTPDMAFGTVCHTAVLTPDKFAESYYLRPETYDSTPKPTKKNPNPEPETSPWNGNATECKTWLLTHADRPVMTKPDLERVAKVRETLTTSPKLEVFRDALKIGKTEVSFFKRDEETGLLLKCRCDLIAMDANQRSWVFDIKKTGSGCATQEEFGKQAWNLGYFIQASFYLEVTGASRFIFVAVDDDSPFDACQWEVSDTLLRLGRLRWRELLTQYAACVKKDEWPGYPPSLNMLHPPPFVKDV